MDPMIFMNMQNQRMLENTQRSSDGLRTNMMREKKEKSHVRKGHHVSDTTDLSGDFGDDMMGGMDMDDLLGGGGGGGAAMFRKMWEDDIEAEEAKLKSLSADTLFDEGQGSSLIPTDQHVAKDPDFTALAFPEPEPEPEEAEAEAPEEPAEEAFADTEAAAEVEEIVTAEEAGSALPEAAEEACAAEAELPEEPAFGGEPAAVSAEKAELTAECPEEELEPEEPDGTKTSSATRSLLDNSEGFILHEDVQEVLEASEHKKMREASPIQIPRELEEALDSLIVSGSGRASQELRFLLSRFGKGILNSCSAAGIKVKILPKQSLREEVCRCDPSLLDKEIGSGAFLPKERLCLTAEEVLDDDNQGYELPRGFHPALYFFAMAWDYTLGEDGFASLKSPVIKANADACRIKLQGHKAPDPMACSSPVHYFAQSVEAYLSANDCAEPLWSRDNLYDFDRMMYDYVEYLYNKSNA